MLLSAALTLLKFRLGSRTDADLDVLIPLEMDQTQFELERGGEPPWFLLSSETTLTTVAATREVAVPADFLLEADDDSLRYIDANGGVTELEKGEYDASILYWGDTQGAPAGYTLTGQEFQIFPLPDAAYTLKLRYFAQDTLPSTMAVGATNLWLTWAPDLLMARTGRRLASYLRDTELLAVFAQEEILAQTRLRNETIAREETNRSRSRGD